MTIPRLKLISHKLCPYVQRARIVLDEKDIPHEIEFIDLANKPDWFGEVSPLGKVPLLLVDGQPLFESNVITEYLDEITPGSLHPDNQFEKARNRSWIEFASATLAAVATFYRAADDEALEQAAETLRQRFLTLEAELEVGQWFNGEAFSIVDAAFAPLFRYFDLIDGYDDFGFFADTPKVSAWRDALRSRESVRHAVVDDYYRRLERFLVGLDSALARKIDSRRVA